MNVRKVGMSLAAMVSTVALLVGLAACAGQKAPAAPVSPLGLPTEGAGPGGAQGLLSYSVPCYVAQGGTNIVAASGCTITVQSGGALTLDSGSTVTGAVANDLNGNALVLDPGGSSSIQATADFAPIITLGGTPTAASLKVNDSAGTPVAVFRGGAGGTILNASGGFAFNGPIAVATSAPLAGVASTAVAPVGVLQPVSMATAGTVPITIPPAGQVVCIWNTGSETVTIADTGNQILSASGALGQYDALCGISDGTRFIEFARSNN